ncbi:MAG: hypothetical protein R3C26_21630 [Calditrichia bacterium]
MKFAVRKNLPPVTSDFTGGFMFLTLNEEFWQRAAATRALCWTSRIEIVKYPTGSERKIYRSFDFRCSGLQLGCRCGKLLRRCGILLNRLIKLLIALLICSMPLDCSLLAILI